MNVAALIGSPVAHSLSPSIHRAAFAAVPGEWAFVSFDVAAGRADAALDAMRTLGIKGLAVTTPHKEEVAAYVDEVDVAAAALRSVNTVAVTGDGHLIGYSTDGDGFVDGLRAEGVDPTGQAIVVLGAGGAARSIVEALGRARADRIAVVNRTPSRSDAASALADVAVAGTLADIATADIVVNATSVGMGTRDSPLPAGTVRAHQVVADIVYHPLETVLLAEGRAAGCRVVDGLSMLVHQAVRQQQLWTGTTPDASTLRAAAEAELASRSAGDTTDTLR
ncbi:MAG: shikimate dehydrogenase [Ilumatobacteraceae bacterium]